MTKLETTPRDLEMMVPEQNIPFLAGLMVFYSGRIRALGSPVLQVGDLALCETLVRRIDISPDGHPLKLKHQKEVLEALREMRGYFGGSIEELLTPNYG